jgi:PAS domain S-box-containing protein
MFQYVSDIHLEYISNIPYIQKIADNLCLVGDIGHPGTFLFNKFLKQCSERYKNVFLVYGNHEYYSILRGRHKKIETMKQKLEYARDFPKNVYFLNNSCVYMNTTDNTVKYKLDDNDNKKNYVKIIGSTLWSDRGPTANNFKNIFMEENQLLTFEHQSKLFFESKYYLIEELYKEDIQSIILTHYTTHKSCSNIYLDNKDSNHIKELFLNSNLIACINGHTHTSIDTIAPGTNIRLLANCFGYKNESQDIVKYNPNARLEWHKEIPVSFSGLYAKSDINLIEILYKIMNRPNPIYDIGLLDEYTPYCISTVSKDNSIIYANRAFEKLTGYTLTEIIGKNCRFLQSPKSPPKRGSVRDYCDSQLLFNVKSKISKKEECQFITYNFTKLGDRFINLVTVIPININQVDYFVGFQCDISSEIFKFKLDKIDTSIIDCNIIKEISCKEQNHTYNDALTDTESISFSASDCYSLFTTDDAHHENKRILYKNFFESNPAFLCILDSKCCFKKVNLTFLNALGYAKYQVYNKVLYDFVCREDIRHTMEQLDTIQTLREVHFSHKLIVYDTSLITVNWVMKLRGNVIYATGTGTQQLS